MSRRAAQGGQSIAEFLVAMAVLLPLFLGIAYVGRYGDLHQTATQASRYAAMQRAMNPGVSEDVVRDQMRARFFLDGDRLHGGKLQSDDSVRTVHDAQGQNGLWRSLNGQALLAKPEDVSLTFGDAAMGSKGALAAAKTMAKLSGKAYTGGQAARVEVSLVNMLPLPEAARTERFALAATTAAGGGALGSSGSKATRDAAAVMVPTSYLPGMLTGFIEKAIGLFEDEGPQLGCIKPDVIYASRLEGAGSAGTCVR